jgi:hypothetical protein
MGRYLTVMKEHMRFMERKKKEEPPIVVKMDKVKVQRVALRSAPPPALRAPPPLPIPSTPSEPSDPPDLHTGKHSRAHHNKIVPFYQVIPPSRANLTRECKPLRCMYPDISRTSERTF